MMNIIAIDVASEVSSVCILSRSGKVQFEDRVPTKISALKRVLKEVARPRQVVFEEGTQAFLALERAPRCMRRCICM